jgi:hypothetical protein
LGHQIFWVFINGFNDGQQDQFFFVNAADGQQIVLPQIRMGKIIPGMRSGKVAIITAEGWVIEMRTLCGIAFSAESKQTWGLNFLEK